MVNEKLINWDLPIDTIVDNIINGDYQNKFICNDKEDIATWIKLFNIKFSDNFKFTKTVNIFPCVIRLSICNERYELSVKEKKAHGYIQKCGRSHNTYYPFRYFAKEIISSTSDFNIIDKKALIIVDELKPLTDIEKYKKALTETF